MIKSKEKVLVTLIEGYPYHTREILKEGTVLKVKKYYIKDPIWEGDYSILPWKNTRRLVRVEKRTQYEYTVRLNDGTIVRQGYGVERADS